MKEELFLQIMQLSKEDKTRLLQALQEELTSMSEGYMFMQPKISSENEVEITDRNNEIIQEQLCLIEFEDHIIHLQKVCDAQ